MIEKMEVTTSLDTLTGALDLQEGKYAAGVGQKNGTHQMKAFQSKRGSKRRMQRKARKRNRR